LSYMHKYFDEVSFGEFSIQNVTTACLYLAGKVEEHRVPVRHIILQVYYYTHKRKLDVRFEKNPEIMESPGKVPRKMVL